LLLQSEIEVHACDELMLELQRTLLTMASLIRELEKIYPDAFGAEGAEVRRYAAGETLSLSEGLDLTRRLRQRLECLEAVKS
jgi:hypothetical protein